MSFQNSTIDVLHSGSGREYGTLQVGKHVDTGGAQTVCKLEGKYSDDVIKTLQPYAHSLLFQKHFIDISNTDFYFTILETIEKIGVVLPENWDVINIGTPQKEEFAFIQSYIPDIIMIWGISVIFPKGLEGPPIVKESRVAEYSTNSDEEDVLIDWDISLERTSENIIKETFTRSDLDKIRRYGDTYKDTGMGTKVCFRY